MESLFVRNNFETTDGRRVQVDVQTNDEQGRHVLVNLVCHSSLAAMLSMDLVVAQGMQLSVADHDAAIVLSDALRYVANHLRDAAELL